MTLCGLVKRSSSFVSGDAGRARMRRRRVASVVSQCSRASAR
jgi:hypothetical protein